MRLCLRRYVPAPGKKHLMLNLTGHVDIWPNNRRPEFVRLGYERVVGNVDPFPTQAHAVMTCLRIPVDVLNTQAVSE